MVTQEKEETSIRLMNNKLAKELRDAGWVFPTGIIFHQDQAVVTDYPNFLKELIEALPERKQIDVLNSEYSGYLDITMTGQKGWMASYRVPIDYEQDWNEYASFGKTPEEALARLWLALHT